MCWLKQVLQKDFACVWFLPHCSSWQQAFLFSKVLVCLVGAKRSTFFSGHNLVDHNIFFQRVSGFVTWLLAVPRRDLMLAFLRSAFLLAILPKRPNLWRNCWCLDRFFHFSIKSLQFCQCCSRLTVTSQTNALFVWLFGLVGWPDCCAFWIVLFFSLKVHTLTTLCYYTPCFYFWCAALLHSHSTKLNFTLSLKINYLICNYTCLFWSSDPGVFKMFWCKGPPACNIKEVIYFKT